VSASNTEQPIAATEFMAADDFTLPAGFELIAADPELGPRILTSLARIEERLGEAITQTDKLADVASRHLLLAGGKRVRPLLTLLAAALLGPVTLVLAQLISIAFGHSWAQFHISGHPSFTSALLSPWFMLLIAPVAEELAWHSYGTDALTARRSLFVASLLFAVYWAFWHMPLAFVKGYYHSQIVSEGALYTVNFVVSMFVFVLLMNWLYAKSGRSIAVATIFHLCANLGNEIFATHPVSKVIQTAILSAVAIYILIAEKNLFLDKPVPSR